MSTSAIAAQLGVSQPSVTRMTKKLAADGLVVRVPYRGVTLTETGRRVALEVLRHHRLLELFLSDRLGMPLDEVHAEADRLEHVLSEELEARIDAALGYPTHDPHGHPIPDAELRLETTERRSLSEVAPGERRRSCACRTATPSCCATSASSSSCPARGSRWSRRRRSTGRSRCARRTGEHAIARELAGAIAVA